MYSSSDILKDSQMYLQNVCDSKRRLELMILMHLVRYLFSNYVGVSRGAFVQLDICALKKLASSILEVCRFNYAPSSASVLLFYAYFIVSSTTYFLHVLRHLYTPLIVTTCPNSSAFGDQYSLYTVLFEPKLTS